MVVVWGVVGVQGVVGVKVMGKWVGMVGIQGWVGRG